VKSVLAESPRFPVPRSSEQGESAPKVRAKAVADGNLVNIPEPLSNAMGGRRKLGRPGVGCPGEECRQAP
jgi:hypothetical protein